jgi:phosphoglycerol transferase
MWQRRQLGRRSIVRDSKNNLSIMPVTVPVPGKRAITEAAMSVCQGALLLLTILLLLGVWKRDLGIPLRFNNDSLQYQMISKTTVDTGWWWFNGRQSAPFKLDVLAYPVNCNVDQGIVWLIARFTKRPAFCVNLAWCVMVALAGVFATICMRRLGVSVWSAFALGSLYGLLPYSLSRDIDFFHIVTYLLPFPCLMALTLASGGVPKTRAEKIFLFSTVCGLIGLNYTYNSFFSCFFILAGSAIGYITYRNREIWHFGGLILLTLMAVSALNLAPSMYLWHRDGKPHMIFDKQPSEAELYGLKIRHLISPVLGTELPGLKKINDLASGARFPLENENTTARLGLVASAGFLGLLLVMFFPKIGGRIDPSGVLVAAARLNLAALLLGTIGGFGSLFNLLVAPDIRAYNRLTPFIGFFSLTAVALTLDAAWPRVKRCFGGRGWAAVFPLAALVAMGIYDQAPAVTWNNATYPAIARECRGLKNLVARVESELPADAMVYQMPFIVYLGDSGNGRMGPYDCAKPYLVSTRLRWSYPVISNGPLYWHERLSRLATREAVPVVRAAGFSAVWVDRYGYEDDAAGVVKDIEALVGPGRVLAEDPRYIVFDIRPLGDPRQVAQHVKMPGTEPEVLTQGLPACSGGAIASVDQIGPRPLPGWAIPSIWIHSDLVVRGWAIWQQTKTRPAGVDLAVDGRLFPAFYGLERIDVANHYGISEYRYSGFRASVPARQFGKGRHTAEIRVAAPDLSCYQQAGETTIEIK